MTSNAPARVTDRDGAYLGRDSPWTTPRQRPTVDVWTVARLPATSSDGTKPTSAMPRILPRRPRKLPSLTSSHSLPLAA